MWHFVAVVETMSNQHPPSWIDAMGSWPKENQETDPIDCMVAGCSVESWFMAFPPFHQTLIISTWQLTSKILEVEVVSAWLNLAVFSEVVLGHRTTELWPLLVAHRCATPHPDGLSPLKRSVLRSSMALHRRGHSEQSPLVANCPVWRARKEMWTWNKWITIQFKLVQMETLRMSISIQSQIWDELE